MRRLLLILLATAPLTGCQYLSAGEDIEIIDPFEGAGETITEAGEEIAEVLDGEADAEPFAEVPADVPIVTADLIRSTDPEARTRLVQQSRIDPFAVLPIPIEPDPVDTPAAGQGASSGAAAAAAAGASSSGPTPPPVRVQEQNEPLVRPSPIATLPRIPQPVIAPTVSVSGIIQLGGEPYAIVSSGSEPERYVRVGDRLAGGSVRVKRIDTMAFEPQVILEENGIEVSRPVNSDGETAAPSTPAEAPEVPVAAIPVSFPVAVPPVSVPQVTLPVGANASRNNSSGATLQVPVLGELPGSLLLLPPEELTSQATLPSMHLGMSENV
ncbi:MAG: hypothetical protein AAGB19_23265 [Cyanobacteria bacterium P01_F01_bin.3]